MSNTTSKHSYAYNNNIHNHTDAYYQKLISKSPNKKAEIEATKQRERAAYQAYMNSPMQKQDKANGFYSPAKGGQQGNHPPGLSLGPIEDLSTRKAGTTQDRPVIQGPSGVASASQTADGYRVQDAERDMKKMAATNGQPLPSAADLHKLAVGIIAGVNANFSGKNGIGDFSQVPGAKMAKTLIASAFQESKFNTQGQDNGGVLQAYYTRVDDYNAHFGTKYSQSDLAKDVSLGAKVGTWAMANPTVKPGWKMVGSQAGNVPIPSDLTKQALYYWNYNPNPGHGHANELVDYMQMTDKYYNQIK